MEQPPVLDHASGNELRPDQVQEVHIEGEVNNKEDTLLNSLPDKVERDKGRTSVDMRRDPYAVHRYVDEEDEDEKHPFDEQSLPSINHDQTDSIRDDL
jgi:hypothetical protein